MRNFLGSITVVVIRSLFESKYFKYSMETMGVENDCGHNYPYVTGVLEHTPKDDGLHTAVGV
jgi:hypothetical protein